MWVLWAQFAPKEIKNAIKNVRKIIRGNGPQYIINGPQYIIIMGNGPH